MDASGVHTDSPLGVSVLALVRMAPSPHRRFFRISPGPSGSRSEQLFIANWTPLSINVHVDCYSADGTLVSDGDVSGAVAARTRERASLSIQRDVEYDEDGNYYDGDEGWFVLFATGPVAPAVRYMSSTYVETGAEWVPIEAVAEFTVDVAPPPPYVAGAAAPEGAGDAAPDESFVAVLSVDQAEEWFAFARGGVRRPPR